MASFAEVNSFIGKFVNLWQSGRDACLQLETQAGQACVTLRLGLGDHPRHHLQKVSPSRQRRRVRRAESRLASAEKVKATEKKATAAEEAVATTKKAVVVEETAIDPKETGNASEEEGIGAVSPIPQVDGAVDSEAEYEFVIDAHETCTSDDIIEAIQTNFLGNLDDRKVGKSDRLRDISIEKLNKDVEINLNSGKIKLQMFKVVVKDSEVTTKIIEEWNELYNFDDLAFTRAVYDRVQIVVRGVQKLE